MIRIWRKRKRLTADFVEGSIEPRELDISYQLTTLGEWEDWGHNVQLKTRSRQLKRRVSRVYQVFDDCKEGVW
jgi:hypothetical protein